VSEQILKPLDARLASWLVQPLRHTSASPSQLTTVRLATGLAAAVGLALPGYLMLGAWLFALSHFLDHTDGELARITGKSSRFGHYYDLIADVLVTTGLFVGLGIGLRHSAVGAFAPLLGVVAGVADSLIFWLHLQTSSQLGARAQVPKTVLFEMEDVLYLVPLVLWLGGAHWFLLASAIGAPAFAFWLYLQYRNNPTVAKGYEP
jgi:archaetidylinositol phosphate synthase